MQGEIQFAKLLKVNNINEMRRECEHRGIEFNDLTWKQLIEKIREQEKENWKRNNPNQEPPDEIKKYFRNLSGADFVIKNT